MSTMAEFVLEPYTHYMSIVNDDRPICITECNVNRKIDSSKFLDYLAKQNDLERAERNLFESYFDDNDDESHKLPRRTRQRNCIALTPYYFNDNGDIVYLEPRQTVWYFMYMLNPCTGDTKFQHKF